MAISGLWHGAAWTFVVWGMYHGLLLIAHNLYQRGQKVYTWMALATGKLPRALKVFIFFHLITLGWVFFRSENLSQAVNLVYKMIMFRPGPVEMRSLIWLIIIAGLFFLHWAEELLLAHNEKLEKFWQHYFTPPLKALVYTVLIAILIIFSQSSQNSFIYFRF
jgi:alginate O-acetyltransferase complex protein AlgI